MSFKWPPKSPTEVLDYSIDWSRLLETTTMITDSDWFIEYSEGEKVSFPATTTVYGLTNSAQSVSGKITTIFLASGTLNRNYKLTCAITDSLGRVTERAVSLTIRER